MCGRAREVLTTNGSSSSSSPATSCLFDSGAGLVSPLWEMFSREDEDGDVEADGWGGAVAVDFWEDDDCRAASCSLRRSQTFSWAGLCGDGVFVSPLRAGAAGGCGMDEEVLGVIGTIELRVWTTSIGERIACAFLARSAYETAGDDAAILSTDMTRQIGRAHV